MRVNVIVSTFIVSASMVTIAAPAQSPADAVKPVSRAQLVKMSAGERLRYNGGWIYSAPTGKVIRVVSAQKVVPASVLDPMIDGFKVTMGLTLFPTNITQGSTFDVVKRGLAIPMTGAVLALIDDSDAPRILCAPEEAWAAVNVRALSIDKPETDVLEKRIVKESWRALSIALGAFDTNYRPCLLAPIHTLKDLDSNPSMVVSPEPFTKMMDNAEKLGIGRVKKTSYRKACYEGWAPPPKNVYQQAIWDMVHAMPTAPIKIKPETKKVRE